MTVTFILQNEAAAILKRRYLIFHFLPITRFWAQTSWRIRCGLARVESLPCTKPESLEKCGHLLADYGGADPGEFPSAVAASSKSMQPSFSLIPGPPEPDVNLELARNVHGADRPARFLRELNPLGPGPVLRAVRVRLHHYHGRGRLEVREAVRLRGIPPEKAVLIQAVEIGAFHFDHRLAGAGHRGEQTAIGGDGGVHESRGLHDAERAAVQFEDRAAEERGDTRQVDRRALRRP